MTIPNFIVESVIASGQPKVDRQARIAELEAKLAKVKTSIAEVERVERFWKAFDSAYDKVQALLWQSLTPEERASLDGAYLFLHNGCVDVVRTLPSSTDHGEFRAFIKRIEQGEALEELKKLYE